LYYDTEDCIDDFRQRVEGGPSEGGQGFIHRAGRLLETLMARYQISRKIKELRTRAEEANDRHTQDTSLMNACPDQLVFLSIHGSLHFTPKHRALLALMPQRKRWSSC
jgi:hypothetical protein